MRTYQLPPLLTTIFAPITNTISGTSEGVFDRPIHTQLSCVDLSLLYPAARPCVSISNSTSLEILLREVKYWLNAHEAELLDHQISEVHAILNGMYLLIFQFHDNYSN